jgi:uncharacterized protein YwgA
MSHTQKNEKMTFDLNKKILKKLTATERYAILLLGANNYEPVRGSTWYQKELFLISKNVKTLEESADFKPDYYGPYSENAKNALEVLDGYNVVVDSNKQAKLTERGKEIFKLIYNEKTDEKQMKLISRVKRLLNDLDRDDLLGFIYGNYKESVDESVVKEDVENRKAQTALRLLKKGKISTEKAAEIADIPLEDFLSIARS